MGEKLREYGKIPRVFLTSPYQRCRKTLEYIQNGWGIEAKVDDDPILANAIAGNNELGQETLLNFGAFG